MLPPSGREEVQKIDLGEIRTVGAVEGRELCLQRLPQGIIRRMSTKSEGLEVCHFRGHTWLKGAPGGEGRQRPRNGQRNLRIPWVSRGMGSANVLHCYQV